MQSYRISLDEELIQVNRAIEFYLDWGEKLRTNPQNSEWVTDYYYGLLNVTKVASLRFRALFFAMRIQPVLSYIDQFVREQKRAPHILDLGCGFGLESTLLCLNGAKVHGVDAVKAKIDGAEHLKSIYEKTYQIQLNLSYERARLFDFDPSDDYDAVYSSATLHHIEPAHEAVKAIARFIKPGGFFFLSDENGYSLPQQIAVQKRIGWRTPRKLWMIDEETGQSFLFGNENIRFPFQWVRYTRSAGLIPCSIKYCRFLPPLDWSIERLVHWERRIRSIPILAQLGAIGFLLTARKPQQ